MMRAEGCIQSASQRLVSGYKCNAAAKGLKAAAFRPGEKAPQFLYANIYWFSRHITDGRRLIAEAFDFASRRFVGEEAPQCPWWLEISTSLAGWLWGCYYSARRLIMPYKPCWPTPRRFAIRQCRRYRVRVISTSDSYAGIIVNSVISLQLWKFQRE